jgi:hypothetical protein
MQEHVGQLERLGEDWAELSGDTATLGRILAEDFLAVGPRGFVLTKEQWLSRHDSGSLTYRAFEWDKVNVRVHENTALTIGRQTASAVYEDGDVRHEIQDQFRATLVFVEEDSWQLLGLHLSPIAGPPAGRPVQDPDGPEERA